MAADNYQAESDMRTMMEAHKIKSDPKRLKACKACAKDKLAAMKAVMGGEEGKGDPKETKRQERAEY